MRFQIHYRISLQLTNFGQVDVFEGLSNVLNGKFDKASVRSACLHFPPMRFFPPVPFIHQPAHYTTRLSGSAFLLPALLSHL